MSSESHDLAGKTIVITGASSGFGRGAAIELAEKGANVILAARRVQLLEELASEIVAGGGTALAVEMDVLCAVSLASAKPNNIVDIVALCHMPLGPAYWRQRNIAEAYFSDMLVLGRKIKHATVELLLCSAATGRSKTSVGIHRHDDGFRYDGAASLPPPESATLI